ncbi:MAG: nicotinamide-nucleotide amidohydrolase family protein [Candidatus Omnitrophica bacterium]|nr:nicotinamide-nucleotide amidohydrolase family protein [Candidatus Omnitrophota bacterium]
MQMPEQDISRKLKNGKRMLSVAESCTGGLLSSRITDIPGSSAYYLGGIIAYSNRVKISVLKVPESLIKTHGAVSRQVARAMARGARSLLNTDISAAITGIAGPGGARPGKPVGTAFMAVLSGDTERTRKIHCKGTREQVKQKFATAVLELISENI